MPQKSRQDPKGLLPPSLQTFYPAAFWKAIPEHPVSYTKTGEQLLPQGHQAAKWTLILHRHFCTRHLHALSLSLSYYCLHYTYIYCHFQPTACTSSNTLSGKLHYLLLPVVCNIVYYMLLYVYYMLYVYTVNPQIVAGVFYLLSLHCICARCG